MAAKKTNTKQAQLVVNNITIQPVNRNTADIDTWRTALKAADRGKRKQLYDLYEDLLLDPILSDAIDKRIEAITNADLKFSDKNGDPVEEMNILMDTTEFEDVLTEIMRAKIAWGITVVEFDFSNGFKPHFIPRKHIRPKEGVIVMNETDETGIPYRDDDHFLEVGKPDDLGLVLKAAPYVIYKRGGFGDWAEYVEIFGMPFQVAKYSNYDEATRQELIRALEASGSNRRVVIPKESDIDYRDNKSSGDGSIYDKLRNACIQEILICILGQTMTTLDGSSKAQGEVHMEVLESKHKSDRRFVQRILNHKLLPMLEKRGFPVGGGSFSFPDAGETVKLLDRMTLTEKAAAMVPVPAYYIYETFGIPKPEDGDEVVQIKQDAPYPSLPDDPTPPDIPQNRLNFLERWFSFFVEAPLQGASSGNHRMTNLADQADDDFDTRLIKRVAKGEATYFDAELFEHFASGFRRAVRRINGDAPVQNIDLDYGVQNDVAKTAMETNLFHFSAAKTLAELQQLNQLYRESAGPADFMEKANQVTDLFNKKWARTEYTTAGLIAESTATYHRLTAQQDLFPYWEYRTAADDKVRQEHRELDGVILPVNDPRWQKIYPPNGWNCRCYVVPRMRHEFEGLGLEAMRARVDDYFGTTEYKNARAQGFGVNRAVQGQVFTENQFYIRKFPQKAAKYLDRLGAADFGLESATKCQKRASQDLPKYEGAAQEWYRRHETGGNIVLEDYNERKVVLPGKNFTNHTRGIKENRVPYLDAMIDTVKNPSEIWINDERAGLPYDNYTIIKYYRDEIMVVCCRVIDGKLNQVRTWYPVYMKKEVINKNRRGLLIYKEAPL